MKTKTKAAAAAPRPTAFLRTPYNYNLGDDIKDMEIPDPVSLTVPDMSMPLKTLIERYTRGLPIPTLQPIYSDEDYPDVEKMDFAELHELKHHNKILIQDLIEETRQIERDIELKKKNPPGVPANVQNNDLPPEVV